MPWPAAAFLLSWLGMIYLIAAQ